MSDEDLTIARKGDHVDIILGGGMGARHNAWDEVTLLHEALPEVDLETIGLSTEFLNHRLDAPLMIASMTGGYERARDINARLAEAAAEHGIAMGVGSQRAMLKDPAQAETYTVVAEYDVPFVAANIGAPQLIPQGDGKPLTHDEVRSLIDAIDADALIVHLNYLQEVVQPEGDVAASGVVHAIEHLAAEIGVPVIAKETGAGMTRRTASRLTRAGCAALDVGGLSGTTFAAVEKVRAERAGAVEHAERGTLFRDWGVPTPIAVLEARYGGSEIVATGGLRSGLDAARALAIGADLAGYASAVLAPAAEGSEPLAATLERLVSSLRTAMFLSGASAIDELAEVPVVVEGHSRLWAQALGHDLTALAAGRLAPHGPGKAKTTHYQGGSEKGR